MMSNAFVPAPFVEACKADFPRLHVWEFVDVENT